MYELNMRLMSHFNLNKHTLKHEISFLLTGESLNSLAYFLSFFIDNNNTREGRLDVKCLMKISSGSNRGEGKRIALKTHLNSTSYEYRSEAQPERLENTHQNETVMDAAAAESNTISSGSI